MCRKQVFSVYSLALNAAKCVEVDLLQATKLIHRNTRNETSAILLADSRVVFVWVSFIIGARKGLRRLMDI